MRVDRGETVEKCKKMGGSPLYADRVIAFSRGGPVAAGTAPIFVAVEP